MLHDYKSPLFAQNDNRTGHRNWIVDTRTWRVFWRTICRLVSIFLLENWQENWAFSSHTAIQSDQWYLFIVTGRQRLVVLDQGWPIYGTREDFLGTWRWRQQASRSSRAEKLCTNLQGLMYQKTQLFINSAFKILVLIY